MEFSRRARRRSAIDLTPLIDVVFQLLVFFILTSSFVQPSVRLELPQGSVVDEAETRPVRLEVDARGVLYVEGERVTKEGLEDALRAALADGRSAVRLTGDKAMAYGLFVEALDTARRAGAAHFDLVHSGKGGEQ